MEAVSEYPLFVPPEELLYPGRKPRQLSRAEAKASFDWFLSVQTERVSHLLNFLSLVPWADNRQLLEEAGKRTAAKLQEFPFSRPEGNRRAATPVGVSIAADMGMLVGQLLIEASNGQIRWALMTETEDHISYHLPVLVGNRSEWHIEPIRASIMRTKQMIKGDEVVRLIEGKLPEHLMGQVNGPKAKVIKAPTGAVWREMYDSSLGKLLTLT